MSLKQFDFLSPKLTLHFYGQSSHSSYINGILTIITYLLYIILFIYFSSDIIFHIGVSSYFYNKVIEDAGIYFLNTSALFHYFKLLYIIADPRIIQILGVTLIPLEQYSIDGKRENYDHYIYSFCNKDMKKYFNKNILSIIDDADFLNNSFCIESFYNSTTGIITKYNDLNFSYPSIKHGMSNPNFTYYGIIAQKCVNSSLNNYSCDTPENIEKKLFGMAFDFRFFSFNVDIQNYKNPLKLSLISITQGYSQLNFAGNNLNFDPLKVKTDNGLLFNSMNEKSAHRFEKNEKEIWESSVGILGAYYFWMQNNGMIYERSYKKIPNILADFGGTTQAIYIIASGLNWIFYKFNLLKDINTLLLNSIQLKNNNNSNDLHFSNNLIFDLGNNSKSLINLNLNNNNKNRNNRRIRCNEHSDNQDKNSNKNNMNLFKIPQIEIKQQYIFYKDISVCFFIKWMICCKQSKFKKSKNISYIFDTYKKFISEENIIVHSLAIKNFEQIQNKIKFIN